MFLVSFLVYFFYFLLTDFNIKSFFSIVICSFMNLIYYVIHSPPYNYNYMSKKYCPVFTEYAMHMKMDKPSRKTVYWLDQINVLWRCDPTMSDDVLEKIGFGFNLFLFKKKNNTDQTKISKSGTLRRMHTPQHSNPIPILGESNVSSYLPSWIS